MLTGQRRSAILTLLDRRQAITAAELARAFGVSGSTIRRDLIDLNGRGLLHRVRGGAVRAPIHRPPPAAHGGSDPVHRSIARLAATTIRRGNAIALSAGVATLALASLLPDVEGLTVITNSRPIATVASRTSARPTLVLIGGVAASAGTHVGSLAHAAIRSVHIQTLYLEVYGMHPTIGLTAPDLMAAEIAQALVRSAQHVVVLAHHSAWGRTGIRTITQLDRADTVISDDGLPADARDAIVKRAGRLLIAGTGASRCPLHHHHQEQPSTPQGR